MISVNDHKCPVFHIHGTNDETVPFKLGSRLYDLSHSEFQPWWVEGGSHLDIVMNHTEEYYQKYKEFFEFCDKKNKHNDYQDNNNNSNTVVNPIEETVQVNEEKVIVQIPDVPQKS